MAIGPMLPDGTKGTAAAPVRTVADAVRTQIELSRGYRPAPAVPPADGQPIVLGYSNPRFNPRPRLQMEMPTQRYVPPSAYEKWVREQEAKRQKQRQQNVMRQYSDDSITSLEELLMPQFDLPTRPAEEQFRQPFELVQEEGRKNTFTRDPDTAKKNEETRIATREDIGRKQNLINEVEKLQSQDPTLPAEERMALQAMRRKLIFESGDDYSETNPLVITIRNLGTRSEFRKKMSDWKSGKTGTQVSTVLPWGLDVSATGEEIDEAGGLGGFLQQADTKASNFDATPDQFGYLIHTDAAGVEHIIRAEEWINLKITDLTPAPGDSPEERERKAAQAADLITTLAFADKYNSFAKKRDAGYRLQLDEAGNPIRAYIHNDDKVALTNLVKDVMAMQEGGVVAPVEEFMKAYADERRVIAEVATGKYGDGTGMGDDGYSGGGYRSGGYYGGGGGYYGGGGDSGGVSLTDPELLKMSVDSISRARMGRSLTNEEALEFIQFYHSMEQAFVSARMSGADATRLDPEAQAVAWIESRMTKEAAGQQAGKLIAALMQALRSGSIGVS